MENIKKVLIIGSGPIVIGQAAEFDYAGVQACRALREEGIETVLVNSNPATIMTDEDIADRIYIEPLTIEVLEKIIEKERPQGIFAGFGGQTSLNLTCELADSGVLEKFRVKVLGSDIETIKTSENRILFNELITNIGLPILSQIVVKSFEDIEKYNIEFPCVLRTDFTLGGAGGAFIRNKNELKEAIKTGFNYSKTSHVVLEKSVEGFKEIEYEIIRDFDDNCIVVCNMENIDAMGIHTGDSIVVAPAQTLNDKQLKMFREACFKIVRALKIVGACNIQFALNPKTDEFYVIEVNPRVSRSSALASKATGFPIAKVCAKLALGKALTDFDKDITNLEPKINYIALKFPKWSFNKFENADRTLTTFMKSTGEVMALGKSLEEAIEKAVWATEENILTVEDDVSITDDLRFYRIVNALKNGKSISEISNITNINEIFIKAISQTSFFTDKQAIDKTYFYPVKIYCDDKKQTSSYFYSSKKDCSDKIVPSKNKKILILGSGPIRIGQGIEFDYGCVHCATEVKKSGIEAVIVNSNPETLSTDYDISSRLYFEPLNAESVQEIIDFEKPEGIIIQFGGQTAINIASQLKNINVLGTDMKGIEATEDRREFSNLLKKLNIPQPNGYSAFSIEDLKAFEKDLTYPVIIRPSYTIGGFGLKVAADDEEMYEIITQNLKLLKGHSVLIDEFIDGTEVEADVVCDGENILMAGILEHIEKSGVHSGDSKCYYPALNISKDIKQILFEYAQKISAELNLKGLMNIQYIISEGKVYVIEVNPRASRTVPMLSKITGIPMCKLAVDIMLGKSLKDLGYYSELVNEPENLFAFKVPVYSFDKLIGADKKVGTEMKSTGEVLGIDRTIENAKLKAFIMSGVEKAFKKTFNIMTTDEYRNIDKK